MILIRKISNNFKVIFKPVFSCLNIFKTKRLFKTLRFNFLILTVIFLTVLVPFKIYLYPPSVSLQEAGAATVIWNGEGGDSNWSNLDNWDGNAVPTGTDIVTFDGTTGTSPDKDCTIDNLGAWSGGDFTIGSDYSGTITLGVDITIGTYSQAGGTFAGGAGTIDINANFTLSGGTFTSTSGELQIAQNFTTSGSPVFNHNNGTVKFDGAYGGSTSIDASGVAFNLVVINRTTNSYLSRTLTVASGTTIPLGDSPTLTLNNTYSARNYHLTNNGTITVGTGTLITNIDGNFTNGNTGTITATNITVWTPNCALVNNGTVSMDNVSTFDFNGYGDAIGSITNNSGAIFTTAASPTFNISGSFIIAGDSTFPNPGSMTFDGAFGASTSIDAPGITFPTPVTISRTINYYLGRTLTIASGTTIPLGNSPTLTVNNTYSAKYYHLTNNGTITVGTGTLITNIDGNFTNSNTITASNITAWTSNGSLVNSGTINMNNVATFDFNSYGSGAGSVTNSSGAALTSAASPTFTVTGSFVIASDSTFPNPGSMTFDGTYPISASIDASGVTFPTPVTINRTTSSLYAKTLTVASGTTIPLGDSPTLTLNNTYSARNYHLTNNGTITVGTGTLITNIDGNFTNGNTGTITATNITVWTPNCALVNNGTVSMDNVSTFDFNGYGDAIGSITNNSGAIFTTAASPTFNISGSFIIAGDSTFPNPGSMTFDGAYPGSTSIDAPGITFPTPVTINRTMSSVYTTTLTIASGTTILLGDSSTVMLNNTSTGGDDVYNLTNNGTITVGTGTFIESVEGTFTNNATIQTKTSTLTGSITQASGSTVIFTGDGDGFADSQTITDFGTTYHHLTINSTDGITDTFLFGAVPTINGDLNVTAGILDTNSQAIAITGSTTIGTGTLLLKGDTIFNGNITVQDGGTLSCATGGTTITIDDADTMTVDSGGTFSLQGASENLITLQSDTTEAWSLIMNGSHDMDYIDVSYSDASGGDTMYAYYSTDSLNNINWVINGGAPVAMDHFTITGNTTQTAGNSQVITITAIGDDSNTYTDYTSDHDLTFSGANISPNSTNPTASDKTSADINFGIATTLTFTAGEATATMKLYTAEAAEIETTDGTYSTTGDASYDLDVVVSTLLSATSIAINDGDSYTNSNSTALTLSATNASQMKFSNDNLTYSTYESYATSKTWDITNASYGGNTNDETKTVYAIFNDIYGNESTAISDTIVYDTTPPTGASIILTSILADSITANVSGATDALSGLSSLPYNFQNITSSTSSSYQAGTSWISNSLIPNTQYSFRVDYEDNANNETQSAIQAAYSLANIPTALSLSVDSTSQIIASWNNNSNPSGTEYYIENITESTNSGWTTNTSWASIDLQCNKEYSFKVRAKNSDGIETSFTSLVSTTTQSCGGGGLPPGNNNPPNPPDPTPDNPKGEISVVINNDDKYAYDRNVTLTFLTGSDTVRMAISNSPNFENASQIPYEEIFNWHLSTCKKVKKSGEQSCNVYAKFYTQYGQSSKSVSDSIILKEDPPILEITVIQDAYKEGQSVIIAGISERLPKITPSLNGEELSDLIPNRYGNWTLELGQLSKGFYELFLSAISEAKIPITLIADILVVEVVPEEEPEIPEIPEIPEEPEIPEDPEIPEIPEIPEDPETPEIPEVPEDPEIPEIPEVPEIPEDPTDPETPETPTDPSEDDDPIPEETPPPFQGGWDLIPSAPVSGFVFLPVPKETIEEIKELAEAFPEVKEKLKEMEVENIDDLKISDLKKLEEELLLPNITKIVNLHNKEITPAISFEELNEEEKEKMPEDIIFVKAAGGKIDIDINLKINSNGSLRKEISTISGQTLSFFIKPKSKTETIKGILVFKSRIKEKENLSDSSSLIFKTVSADEETKLVISEFNYSDTDNDGIYTTNIKIPSAEGEFDVLTEIDYQDSDLENKNLDLTIISNPEGYVYERIKNQELRIKNAVVSLYQLNQEANQYELFPANEYEQKNPITTDMTGRYSFIIPQGTYYFTIEVKDYLTHQTELFEAKEGFNINRAIELKKDSSNIETEEEKENKTFSTIIYFSIILLVLFLIFFIIKKLFSKDRNDEDDIDQSRN